MKVHSIELHAKLLRARELPALLAAHVDPMVCAWVRHFARGSDDMRVGPLIRAWFRWYARQRRPGAYLGVEVRVAGLTRMFSGSCASDTPGQAPLRPQRRPPCPRHPVVGVCRRGGLRLGRHAAPRRGLTDSKRGNCTIRGATRRRHAEGRLLMLQNPHPALGAEGSQRRTASRSRPHHRTSGPSRPCQPLFVEVVCDLGATYPRTATSPPRTAASLTASGGGVALYGDPCVTCLPMTSPSNGGELHH